MLPGSVFQLEVVSRLLTEIVPDNAVDRCLRSVGSAVGEVLVWDSTDLLTDLSLDDAGIIRLSESTIRLYKFELVTDLKEIP